MRTPPLVVLALTLAACPPPDDGAAPDAGVPDGGAVVDAGPGDALDVAAFCARVHGAVCDGFASCGCTLEGRAFDAASCAPTRVAACEASLAPVAEADVDEAQAAACFAGIDALVATCAIVDETTLPLACAVFLVDDVALGAACTLPLPAVCAGGAGFCGGVGTTCAPRPDEGLRPAPVDEGGACEATAQCAAGLACVSGSCAPGVPRGTPCGGPFCASGDACVRDYDSRTCQPHLALGDVCSPLDDDCAPGTFCDAPQPGVGDAGGEVGACAPLPVESEPCTPSLACAEPFRCDADNGLVCITAPGEGDPCTIGSALCAPGLGCDVDNVCSAPPGAGEECLLPQLLCAEGLACDFTFDGSICAERRGEGGACQNDAVCAEGLYCGDEGACTPTLPLGAGCPTGGGCGTDDDPPAECSDLGGGFTCQLVPDAVGAPCFEACATSAAGPLACSGPGGVCAPALCASP